jgi:hypothetical protein
LIISASPHDTNGYSIIPADGCSIQETGTSTATPFAESKSVLSVS